MNDHDHSDQLEQRLEDLGAAIEELRGVAARNFLGGEIERFHFDGKAGLLEALDDHGSNALAYAVYNPNNFRVFVGLAGTSAAADSFVVPKQKLVVAPVQVNGHIELAASAEDIAEGSGFIWRVRFPTPQPFFVGALA